MSQDCPKCNCHLKFDFPQKNLKTTTTPKLWVYEVLASTLQPKNVWAIFRRKYLKANGKGFDSIYGSGTWDNQNICCDASLTDYTMTAFVEFCPKSIFETNLNFSYRSRQSEKFKGLFLRQFKKLMHQYCFFSDILLVNT